ILGGFLLCYAIIATLFVPLAVSAPASLQSKFWRLPDRLLEPRGNFLGSLDERVDSLNRARTTLAIIIIVCVAVAQMPWGDFALGDQGFVELLSTIRSHAADPLRAIVIIILWVPVVATVLVLYARPGARRDTLLRMVFGPMEALAGLAI